MGHESRTIHLKGAVLFMKFAKKLYDDEDWRNEFPIKLVA